MNIESSYSIFSLLLEVLESLTIFYHQCSFPVFYDKMQARVRDLIKLLTDEVAIELGLDSKSYSKAIAHTIRGETQKSLVHILELEENV
jgi:hypothetical protein